MKNNCLIALVLLLLWGCANKQTDTTAIVADKSTSTQKVSSEKTKLRWLAQWYGEGDKERFIREIAREFSLLNQDIDLQLEFPDQVFKYKLVTELPALLADSITKMVKSGVFTWDIFPCDQYKYRLVGESLGTRNWGSTSLVDFSQKDWFESAHKNGIITNVLRADYGGIIPGTIIEGITQILFVSEDVEKLLGITVKRTDMNFSDFVGYAKAVDQYNQTHEPKITFFSTQYMSVRLLAVQLAMSAYGKLTSPTRQEALAIFLQLYQTLAQLAPYHAIEQYTTFPNMSWNDAQRVLNVDKFLFNMQPSWINQYWKMSNPKDVDKMKPCEIPSMDNKIAQCYAGFFQSVFVVPKSSKSVEAAERLMKFMASKEIGEKWVNYSKCPTGIKTQLASSDFGQSDYDLYFRHIENKYGKNQIDINLSYFFFLQSKELNLNLEGVIKGMAPQDAMKELEKQLR